jgi:hypothetical protein
MITWETVDWNPPIRLWLCSTYGIPFDLPLKKKICVSTFHYFFVIQNFIFHFLHYCAKNNRPSTYVFHESPADTVLCNQENKAAGNEVPFTTTGQFSIQTAVILKSQCAERLCLIFSHWFSLLPLLFTCILFTFQQIFKHFLCVGDSWKSLCHG